MAGRAKRRAPIWDVAGLSASRSQPDPSGCESASLEKSIAPDLDTIHSTYDITQPQFTSRRKFLGPILIFIKRVLSRLLLPVLARQTGWNAAQTRLVAFLKDRVFELSHELRNARQSLLDQHHRLMAVDRETADLRMQMNLHTSALLAQRALTPAPGPEGGKRGEEASSSFHSLHSQKEWYSPIILGPSTVGRYATSRESRREVMNVLSKLRQDDVMKYLLSYYQEGEARYGDSWQYADIATILVSVAKLMRPQQYLEIGVFHGRSMAIVAALSPQCELVGFDQWMPYAEQSNPGPDLVHEQLKRVGHQGTATLISGNSHQTLPEFFRQYPNANFDLITVDGDHTEEGAAQDLRDVLPHLKLGGFLVFDDLYFPGFEFLSRVWFSVVASDPRFLTWEFRELGNGVAIAMRRS